MSEVGRPTKYKPEYCNLLIEHMAAGLSFESFGAVVECSKQTIYDWLDAQPEFLDAKKIGTAKSLLFWEKLGIRGTVGVPVEWNGKQAKGNFNSGSWIFNMKNRFGWRDKVEHSGDKTAPLVLNYKIDDSE